MKKLLKRLFRKPPDTKASNEDVVNNIINHYLENNGRGWFRPVRMED